MHPAGLSARALARCLYGGVANPVTVRAEVARLRRVVDDLVDAQPYRLTAEIPGRLPRRRAAAGARARPGCARPLRRTAPAALAGSLHPGAPRGARRGRV